MLGSQPHFAARVCTAGPCSQVQPLLLSQLLACLDPNLNLPTPRCARFLNTIIDDLFAFVIKMPLLHRLSGGCGSVHSVRKAHSAHMQH